MRSEGKTAPNESQSAQGLSDWQTQGINPDFVMCQNLTVNDPASSSRIIVFKDIRNPRSPRYFCIKQLMPLPPDGATPQNWADIRAVYATCLYRMLQPKESFFPVNLVFRRIAP